VATLYDLAEGVSPSQSFEKFMQVTETTSAVTVEDFLADWKKADPLVFRFYLLSFRSRSLQSSTPQAPRAILFSPAADFMASFNGHGALRGSRNIEMIRFDHNTEKFEFRELSFDLKNPPSISEPNPQKCLECHQSFTRTDVDPRPNWEPYFMWPGFFGMTDGAPLTSEKQLTHAERERLDPILDAIILNETRHEDEWYTYFWSHIAPQDGRYAFLDPYNKELGAKDAKLYGSHAARDLKTTMFTQRIAQVNFRRVARLMTEDTVTFDYLKEALVGILSCGTRKFPEEFLKWLHANSSIRKDANLLNLNLGDKIKLLFEPFYYDTDDWSMDFKTNARFAFANRFGTPGIPDKEMSEIIAQKSPSFRSLKGMACNPDFINLLKKYENIQTSVALQNRRSGFKDRIEAIKNTPLMNRCVRCHASPIDFDIPQISFDNATALQQQLHKGGYKRGRLFDEILYRIGVHATSDEQMPPQSQPTAKQREDLIKYLQGLMSERTDRAPF
jgi:hypothetical protein